MPDFVEDLGELPLDGSSTQQLTKKEEVREMDSLDDGRVPEGMQVRHEDDEEGGEQSIVTEDKDDRDEDKEELDNANNDADAGVARQPSEKTARPANDNENDEEEEEDGDEEDEEEDDDDEEEEEDEDGEEARPRKKKRRRARGANRYVDIEVEVDEDEDEDEEEAGEAGFEVADADNYLDRPGRRNVLIADSFEGDEDDLGNNDRDHRQLERRVRDREEAEALRIAQEYKERHRQRRTGMGIAAMQDFAPRSVLMPSVNDPSIWCVKCKIGRERELVMSISRKAIAVPNLGITSAFQRDSFHGHLYIEARSEGHVRQAVEGLVGVYMSNMPTLVPIEEMPDLLKSRKKETPLALGGWVRIKRGTYKGDLGQVEDVPESTDYVTLKVVPRIDLNPKDDSLANDANGKKRRRQDQSLFRAPAKFFNAEEVRQAYQGKAKVLKDSEGHHFAGELYVNGYLIKDFKMHMLDRENINHTIDEITRFIGETAAASSAAGADGAGEDGSIGTGANRLDLNLIADAAKAQTVLQPGDYVEIFEGSQKGIIGSIASISNNILHVSPSEPADLVGTEIEVLAHQVRKRFKAGDHVKVLRGKNVNESGLVLKIKDDLVTFLSDLSVQEVTVFSKDIREAAEVGAGASSLAQFELDDLVQLDSQTTGCVYKVESDAFRVLDQLGATRLVKPSQISNRVDTRRQIATDAEGYELRAGDVVKEVGLLGGREPRQGRVLHVYRSQFAFLHNRDIVENGGVFVAQARQLASVAPRAGGAKGGPADLTKMNPEMQAGLAAYGPAAQSGLLGAGGGPPGREPAIGQFVMIIKGNHKGLKGICKDMNGPLARVELHTNNKTITIERTKLGVESSGRIMPLAEWESERLRNRTGGARTPLSSSGYGNGSNATPLFPNSPGMVSASPGSYAGGMTPRTYAGGRTGMYMGGKTPAYGGATPFAGNATPFHAGSSTPYAGGKTTAAGGNAFAASSRTPFYAGGDSAFNASSRTPYAGGAGGAWNAGGATPAYPGAPGASGAWGASASPAYRPNPPAGASASSAWATASPAPNSGAGARYSSGPTPAASSSGGAWGSTSPAYQAQPGRSAWDSVEPAHNANTPYASAPTPAAQTPYPSAPTPAAGADAWGDYDSAPTPAASHPTPYQAAATPAAGNAWDD